MEALLGSPPPSILEETEIIDTNPDFMENMKVLDEKLEALAREKEADLEEMRANAVLRDRIENEINEEVLEKLFNDNLDFLKVFLLHSHAYNFIFLKKFVCMLLNIYISKTEKEIFMTKYFTRGFLRGIRQISIIALPGYLEWRGGVR